VEFKSGATFQPEWLKALHAWTRHAASARQGQAMLVSAAPGNPVIDGVMCAHWRDAAQALVRAD
jgi:hypothetical protein